MKRLIIVAALTLSLAACAEDVEMKHTGTSFNVGVSATEFRDRLKPTYHAGIKWKWKTERSDRPKEE